MYQGWVSPWQGPLQCKFLAAIPHLCTPLLRFRLSEKRGDVIWICIRAAYCAAVDGNISVSAMESLFFGSEIAALLRIFYSRVESPQFEV